MVTALYRRYRPENFAELIGQSQVTDPLRTALRTNRVNHAYLFSGPRGCGKTTSARILARCLNCAEGPTDTPCGVCPSCVELARGGGGSLDVIEIDAASHNGVDDARDLRDRAVFAPARDRYKIFILDEAHMVTPQGFNALLKLVEEPPEHVKFIFATTEPEKVIGTIRSRTHHYPFRLVPPATMLEYIEQLCAQESVSVAPGVLPLVVRAGGGSVRDTLSLLDQLMAGSEDGAIAYERAVALLGYTDAALLDDVVDALAVADPASAFSAIDRVVQTGQDPRRFVEDLLERLRDLIVVAATNESAGAVLRGISPEELDTMSRQAAVFGATALSRGADIANRALTEMTGATSPRLHLELMVARMLVPEADDTQRGALARVERLERRVGVGDAGGHQAGPADLPVAAPQQPSAAAVSAAPQQQSAPAARSAAPASAAPSDGARTPAPSQAAGTVTAGTAPARDDQQSSADPGDAARSAAASWAAAVPADAPEAAPGPGAPASASSGDTARAAARPESAPAAPSASAPTSADGAPSAPGGQASPSSTGVGTVIGDEPAVRPVTPVGLQQMRDTWPQIVEHVQHAKRSAWAVVATAQVTALRDDVLTLTFPSQQDVASFKEMSDPHTSVSEHLRSAILDILGFRVKFVARGPATGAATAGAGRQQTAPAQASSAPTAPAQASSAPTAPAQTAPAPAQNAPTQSGRAQSAPGSSTSSPDGAGTPDHGTLGATAAPARPQGSGTLGASSPQHDAQATAPEHGASATDRSGEPERPAGATPPEAPARPEQQSQDRETAAPARPNQEHQGQDRPSQDRPAAQAPAPAAPQDSGPVTEWAVATIPVTDPTAGAVPEHVEPSWGAPFGVVPGDAPVAPVEPRSTQPAPSNPPAASSDDGGGGGPDAAGRAAAGAARPSGAQAAPPVRTGGHDGGGSPAGPVPVDDYPLDDEPYDDGAPFPDPGPRGGRAAPSAPPRRQDPAPAVPQQPAQAAPTQAAPTQSAPQQRQAPQQAAGGQSGVRRTPVPGRYGEAVVREILGAQFIEETSLSEGSA